MESSLPELTRCILRASTHDDYRQIIDHAPGTFSLQEAIANDYNTLFIGQVLPATDHYPQLTIVDLLPTTRALLTHNASTFIVLAPEAILENEKRQRIAHECASLSTYHVSVNGSIIHREDDQELIYSFEEDAVLEELNAARVIVQVDKHLPSHVCCANEEFMQRIACVFDSDDDDDNTNNITDDNDHHNEENHINEHVNLNGCNNSARCEGGKHRFTQNRTSSLLKYDDQEPYLISIGERMRRFVFVVYPLVKNCDLHNCDVNLVGASNRIDNSTLIKKSNYMYLYAGVDVFRNMRAACLRDASYQSHINTWNRQLPFVSFSESLSSMPTKEVNIAEELNKTEVNDRFNIYYTHTFAIPSDMCSLVLSSMHDDKSQCTNWALAQKVSLCSAIDNFIMTNTYGEEYGDLLSTVMLQCASQLNNRIVNVGDVITLRLSSSTLHTCHEFDNGERVAEVAWSTLEHYSEKGDAIWADIAESSECTEILFPMRVTEVVGVPCSLHDASNETKRQDEMCEYNNPYGIICLPVSAQNNNEAIAYKNKHKLQTEIRLVSQSALTNNEDTSPLYVRCRESASSCYTHDNAIDSLNIVQELREIINKHITPSATFDMMTSRFSAPLVLVIHGIRQNFGSYFVHHVLEHAGVPMAVASVEGLKEEELEELLHKFSSQCGGPAALILHHAERLHEEYTHLLSLIHSSSTTLLSSHSTSAHVLPWHTNNIIKSDNSNGDDDRANEQKGYDTNGSSTKGTKVIVLLCESVEAVAPALAACATNASGVIECSNPSEQDRQIFLTYYLDALCDKHHVHQSMLLSMSSLAA